MFHGCSIYGAVWERKYEKIILGGGYKEKPHHTFVVWRGRV
jgi:hypothetical protein